MNSPIEEPPDEASVLIDYWGGVAYDAYFRHCQGKSIHGQTLPSWDNQAPAIRAHWYAAANAVRDVAVEEHVGSLRRRWRAAPAGISPGMQKWLQHEAHMCGMSTDAIIDAALAEYRARRTPEDRIRFRDGTPNYHHRNVEFMEDEDAGR